MTLFSTLTPKSEALINEYPDLINDHLEEWINRELASSDKRTPEEVIKYLSLARIAKNPSLMNVELSPNRRKLITNLIKLGHGIEQFKGVIDYMIKEFWDTPYRKSMITPEFMFRPSEFQKYLEQARDKYAESKKKTPSGPIVKNQYDNLMK